jgi:hypothetical protein
MYPSLNESDVGPMNTIANDPNEGVMERNGVKRNNRTSEKPERGSYGA